MLFVFRYFQAWNDVDIHIDGVFVYSGIPTKEASRIVRIIKPLIISVRTYRDEEASSDSPFQEYICEIAIGEK